MHDAPHAHRAARGDAHTSSGCPSVAAAIIDLLLGVGEYGATMEDLD